MWPKQGVSEQQWLRGVVGDPPPRFSFLFQGNGEPLKGLRREETSKI